MSDPNKFCGQCGGPIKPEDRFCGGCGKPVDGAAPAPASPATPALSCPKCNQSDQTVLAGQYSTKSDTMLGSGKSDDERYDGDTVETFLERPQKPDLSDAWAWVVVPWIPVCNFILCWFAPINWYFKLVLLFFVTCGLVCTIVPSLYATGIQYLFGTAFLIFFYIFLFASRGSRRRKFENEQLPAYNRQIARYEHLCYCKRCQEAWLDSNPAGHVRLTESRDLFEK